MSIQIGNKRCININELKIFLPIGYETTHIIYKLYFIEEQKNNRMTVVVAVVVIVVIVAALIDVSFTK